MTLLDFINQMEIGVARNDLRAQYKTFINQAIKKCMQLKSWNCMIQKDTVTIIGGQSLTRLPGDFKELTRGRSPIGVLSSQEGTPNPIYLPCSILNARQLERLNTFGSYNGFVWYGQVLNPYQIVQLPVYLDFQDNYPTLNLICQTDIDVLFMVNYYRWLPPLEADGDENPLTMNFPEMIINKAMSIAFQLVKDESWQMHEQIFRDYYKEASRQDSYSQVAGVCYQM